MKIIIDMPKKTYEELKTRNVINVGEAFSQKLIKYIKNGIPLPKGHGDLIDKGKFKKWIETQDGDKLMTEYYLDALDMQETIVGGSHDGDID